MIYKIRRSLNKWKLKLLDHWDLKFNKLSCDNVSSQGYCTKLQKYLEGYQNYYVQLIKMNDNWNKNLEIKVTAESE